MFVTSDCHDLEQIALDLPYNWREVLVAGVGCNAPSSPRAERAAQFLQEGARTTSVHQSMQSAGYTLAHERRTRNVKPLSFEATVGRAERAGRLLSAVLYTGVIPIEGAASNNGTGLFVGGEIDGVNGGPLRASFVYPESGNSKNVGQELLRLAARTLGAEYGYYFVRDDALLPRGYALGAIGGLAAMRIESRIELDEVASWGDLTREEYWELSNPPLRDVYEVNLLSDRHLAHCVGNTSLAEWIQGDVARGSLVELDERRWLWNLSATQIQIVRPELRLAGVLFSRHERVYRSR